MSEKSKNWMPEEVELLTQLRPTQSITQIYERFQEENKKNPEAFKRTRKAIKTKALNLGVFFQAPIVPAAEVEEQDIYSEAWDKIVKLKEKYKEEYEHRITGVMKKGEGVRKILTLSDFHIPFDRDDLVLDIIEEHKDADILVVNGDMLDLYAVSTWPKEKSVVLRKEYNIALEYLKIFSKMFPSVVVTRGNHEYRLNRYFHSNVSKSVSFMVNVEILGRLVNGEEYDNEGNIVKKHDFSNVYYDNGPEAWFCKIGKTMFLHPQAFSKVEGKTAVQAQEYFMEREDVDCIVVAHTHHQAWVPTRGKLCIEQGCLCVPLDYEKQGKLRYKAMVLGYAVVYQDKDGNCDINRSRPYYLGTQYPIKRSYDAMLLDLKK